MKRWYAIVGLALLVITSFVFKTVFLSRPPVSSSVMGSLTLDLPGGSFLLDLPRTPEQFTRGLGGRDHLAPQTGMLFLFRASVPQAFWMKEMRFPIDILFLQDGVVVKIAANLPAPLAGEAPVRVTSDRPINGVLEVGAGEASAHGWTVGTRLFSPESIR